MQAIGKGGTLAAVQHALAWVRVVGLTAVLGNASSLSATAVVTSALGFVFWSVAARQASPSAIGLAAAAVSASTLLATISMLGLGTLLIGEVAAGRESRSSFLTTSLLVVGGVGGVLGAVFAVVGPQVLTEFQPLGSVGLGFVALFALAVGGTAVGLLTDQLMVGLLHGELQLARNTFYAVLKLAALLVATPLLVRDAGIVLFAVWPLGNLLSILVMAGVVLRRPIGISLGRPRFELVRNMGSAALSHHMLNLALQAPAFILPILVTVVLSTTANAYFYTAWMIATVAFLPQTALAVTLYALGARDPAQLTSRARLTFALGLTEGVVAIGAVQVAASWLLAGFGSTYSLEASSSLRILILAVLPMLIKVHFVALARVRRSVRTAAVVIAVGACVELVGAAVGARLAGLQGLCTGWLLGMCLEGACMFPSVWRMVLPRLPAWSRPARIEPSLPR